MANHALELRRAVVQALRAAPAVTSRVRPQDIYGEEVPSDPAWPFIRYGFPDQMLYESSCRSGEEQEFSVDVFAEGPGMDAVTEIASAVRDVLDNADLSLATLRLQSLDYRNTLVLRDSPESTNYHAVVRFTAITTE